MMYIPKTVKGPSPDSVSTRSAAVTAATNVDKSGVPTANSTMVPAHSGGWPHPPSWPWLFQSRNECKRGVILFVSACTKLESILLFAYLKPSTRSGHGSGA